MSTKLFEPITLGGVELPNRFTISPMCQYAARDGHVAPWHQQHVGSLALGGAGLFVMEATGVLPEGRITPACLGIWSEDHEAGLAKLLRDVRTYAPDQRFGLQLAHAGRKASSDMPWKGGGLVPPQAGGWQPVGPSPVSFDPARPAPQELDQPGIHRIRQAFVTGAERADRAGFDAIELHAAHGYLLHSFNSPLGNERTDAYGGSFANRTRAILEIAAAVRLVWPKEKILGARITGSDWHEEGLTPDDAARLANELADIGLDYITVSSGGIRSNIRVPVQPCYQVPFAGAVKRAVGNKVAVQAVGLIVTPQEAEQVIADGHADMVAIARGYLDDTRWGQHAADALGAAPAWHVRHERAGAAHWPGSKFRNG
ncbi:MAG TPA: NADH:flavin oxidoreductase/NADH oxidase [Geminicoccus sp.]|jgi:2,4-dienoyl-CoA reductase-like NADH-dependent reductase (Old Yellow Enzyme family)|uniref:NADH:flavin oxidoreductase/NADH oxidase n=1 Tax=Geminicoccus sp. TaxID=2024832 RepID=UPI002E37BE4B|nr:NADH:flavin oxidoreductase/NADH oxidase [Geminicoccus sp.]HEX2526848.1 NADH:flavin oxidoreductase/NADH oxidase [Geminicoccus sp.]